MSEQQDYAREDLEAMTVAQLCDVALEQHDVKIDPDDFGASAQKRKPGIVGYILALQDGRAHVQETDKLAAEGKLEEPVVGKGGDRVDPASGVNLSDRVDITIHKQDTPDGSLPVKLSLNGYPLVVPRGVRVSIPRAFVGVMEAAVYKRHRQAGVDKDTGEMLWEEEDVPRFAYTVHGPSEPQQDGAEAA